MSQVSAKTAATVLDMAYFLKLIFQQGSSWASLEPVPYLRAVLHVLKAKEPALGLENQHSACLEPRTAYIRGWGRIIMTNNT